MKNFKTTLTGVLMIVVAVGGGLLVYLQTGHFPDFTPIIASVVGGVGLITARDSKPTDLTPMEQVTVKAIAQSNLPIGTPPAPKA